MDKYELNFTTTEIVSKDGVHRAVEIEGVKYKPHEVRRVEVDDVDYDVMFANGFVSVEEDGYMEDMYVFEPDKKYLYNDKKSIPYQTALYQKAFQVVYKMIKGELKMDETTKKLNEYETKIDELQEKEQSLIDEAMADHDNLDELKSIRNKLDELRGQHIEVYRAEFRPKPIRR